MNESFYGYLTHENTNINDNDLIKTNVVTYPTRNQSSPNVQTHVGETNVGR